MVIENRVPAAGRETLEKGAGGSGLIEMERLQVELPGIGLDRSGIHRGGRRGESLTR